MFLLVAFLSAFFVPVYAFRLETGRLWLPDTHPTAHTTPNQGHQRIRHSREATQSPGVCLNRCSTARGRSSDEAIGSVASEGRLRPGGPVRLPSLIGRLTARTRQNRGHHRNRKIKIGRQVTWQHPYWSMGGPVPPSCVCGPYGPIYAFTYTYAEGSLSRRV